MKTCSKCKETKEDTEFHPSTSRGTLQSWCKQCKARDYAEKREVNKLKRKEWYLQNKSKVLSQGKAKRKDINFNTEYNIKRRCRKYGISERVYYAKLAENKGCCEICKNPFNSTPAIDHDHITFNFRSLLCDNCNTALGLLKENLNIINNMIEYLNKHKK